MKRSSRYCSLVVPVVVLAGGCYANEEDDPGFNEFRSTGACTTCGYGNGNSPYINRSDIPELHQFGLPNSTSVTIIGVRSPAHKLHHLRVIDDEFVALKGSTVVASGGQLVGWTIILDTPDGQVDVHISAHDGQVPSLVDGGPMSSAYGLKYEHQDMPGELISVCPGEGADDAVVTLVLGETYDPELKLVNADQAGWFTLACGGEAVAKMKLLNYGPSADFDGSGEPATVDQRQATLKMITADYCGTGTSYTVQGLAVVWADEAGTVGPTSPPAGASVEAIWTADGAVCLDTPRWADPQVVAEECVLPSCDQISPNTPGIVWRTYHP
ncbi:MAG TPA: ADYC domain-containing protein [Nannocystis sp.]|jgi:hypothetical protein